MTAETLATHIAAWLAGLLMGAGGQYMADKWTDQRREKEATSKRRRDWETILKEMPDLIQEMQDDWSKPEHRSFRRFYTLHQGQDGALFQERNIFLFYHETHTDLDNRMAILEGLGFIQQVDERGMLKGYQVTEEFIGFLVGQEG